MSEEKLPFIEEIAELISTKMEQGEMDNDIDYVLTCLKEKIKENLDIDYDSEDDIASESETDEEDLIKEILEINQTEEGFYEIKDIILDCDRIGRSNKKSKI